MLCMPNNLLILNHCIYVTTYIKVTFMVHPNRPLSWWLFYSYLITSHLLVFCFFSGLEPCVEDEPEAEAGSPDIEPGTELDEGLTS